MAKQEPKSNLPLIIIGAVVLAGLLAAWYFYSGSKTPTNTNRPANAANNTKPPSTPVANAPAGATPPNMAGSPTALVTVEEFADFQCPTCATTHPMMSEIKSIYGNRIKFIYRNFPLAIPAHDKSYEASVAAEAAGMQGKFWDFQNLLFTNQAAWSGNPGYKEIWNGYAQKLGIDVAKWQSDIAGIAAKSRVDEDMKRGRALNVNSTPTILINGVNIDSKDFSVAGLKYLIDNELQKTAGSSQSTSGSNTATNSAK